MKPKRQTRSKTDQKINPRVTLDEASIRQSYLDALTFVQGKFPSVASLNDKYIALSYAVRDRLLHRWTSTAETYRDTSARTVIYLSAEFLLGPHLGNNLLNLGIYDTVKSAMKSLDLDLDTILDQEEEPGLGNGGLGRLAACFMDSLATLHIPAIGYGIRYEFGIFDQEIRDGWQVEITDKWLRKGNPWEIARPEITVCVKFGGHTESIFKDGKYLVKWIPHHVVNGVAYDTPIMGYKANTANMLRLWKAEACESFDFRAFNVGDYYGAVQEKMASENITKVLYPNDEPAAGKQLRLSQQYFFTACALQDMIRIFRQRSTDMTKFHEKYVVQLNDTHPSIAVAELMRLLMDEYDMEWTQAWDVTRRTFAYTNHTLLPEALEKWPVRLFASLLPRHLEIIYEINKRFLDEVRARYPGNEDKLRRLSLIDESGERYIRMAHLACVGSSAVNGVARLHSELLKQDVLRDFYELTPAKFTNVTNGVTQRRFLALSNPDLASLITDKIGDSWIRDLCQLRRLEPFASDASFRNEWMKVKAANKRQSSNMIRQLTGVETDPYSLFDIQAKRIHEYKRQHLNVLHIITLYLRIKKNPSAPVIPRTFIFGGKAAPGYFMAKLIIKLIHSVADVVNNDPDVRDRLKVVFYPNFNVQNSQFIYPAADLSEQISTAGKEASGTGNMKFSMNGALTIGTLDGANVEIRDAVGEDNFFLFGLTAQQVQDTLRKGYYPRSFVESDPELRDVMNSLTSGMFAKGNTDLFRPLADSLLNRDDYLLMADYRSYMESQEKVSRLFDKPDEWAKQSILNVARMGDFSSDRSIREYCERIWKVTPVHIELNGR